MSTVLFSKHRMFCDRCMKKNCSCQRSFLSQIQGLKREKQKRGIHLDSDYYQGGINFGEGRYYGEGDHDFLFSKKKGKKVKKSTAKHTAAQRAQLKKSMERFAKKTAPKSVTTSTAKHTPSQIAQAKKSMERFAKKSKTFTTKSGSTAISPDSGLEGITGIDEISQPVQQQQLQVERSKELQRERLEAIGRGEIPITQGQLESLQRTQRATGQEVVAPQEVVLQKQREFRKEREVDFGAGGTFEQQFPKQTAQLIKIGQDLTYFGQKVTEIDDNLARHQSKFKFYDEKLPYLDSKVSEIDKRELDHWNFSNNKFIELGKSQGGGFLSNLTSGFGGFGIGVIVVGVVLGILALRGKK